MITRVNHPISTNAKPTRRGARAGPPKDFQTRAFAHFGGESFFVLLFTTESLYSDADRLKF